MTSCCFLSPPLSCLRSLCPPFRSLCVTPTPLRISLSIKIASLLAIDFTVKVNGVPPDITEDEVAEHFRNLLDRKVVEVRTWYREAKQLQDARAVEDATDECGKCA